MKWGLQHVKVTLEDADSGEVVVIEQRPDGTLICKEGSGSKSAKSEEKAANERPKEHAKAAEPKAEPKPKAPKKDEAKATPPKKDEAKKAESKKAETKKPRKPRESKPSEAKAHDETPKSSKKALAWDAIKDNNYDGFAAKVRVGIFKALHARNTQWALFFERTDNYPAHLGCFRKLEQAKARAQELHDSGWPETEFGGVTRELVERACPLPGADREEKPTMKAKREEKAEAKSETKAEDKPAPPAPAAPAANESADAVMMRSFTSAAESLLADDEDDD